MLTDLGDLRYKGYNVPSKAGNGQVIVVKLPGMVRHQENKCRQTLGRISLQPMGPVSIYHPHSGPSVPTLFIQNNSIREVFVNSTPR